MRNVSQRVMYLNTWSPAVGVPRNPFMMDHRVYDEINPPLFQLLLVSIHHSNRKPDRAASEKTQDANRAFDTGMVSLNTGGIVKVNWSNRRAQTKGWELHQKMVGTGVVSDVH